MHSFEIRGHDYSDKTFHGSARRLRWPSSNQPGEQSPATLKISEPLPQRILPLFSPPIGQGFTAFEQET